MNREEFDFWCDVEKKRNLFFAVWVGWLAAGPVLWMLFNLILSPDDPMTSGMLALGTWGAFWYWTAFRVSQIRCLRCSEKAFRGPFFFMKHARCRHCSFSHSGT